MARRQPRREGFSPTFAVCVRRRFEPLSLLRRQLPSQGSQTAGNIALSHTRPCRENRKQRHCTDSCRPCVLAEITFSKSYKSDPCPRAKVGFFFITVFGDQMFRSSLHNGLRVPKAAPLVADRSRQNPGSSHAQKEKPRKFP